MHFLHLLERKVKLLIWEDVSNSRPLKIERKSKPHDLIIFSNQSIILLFILRFTFHSCRLISNSILNFLKLKLESSICNFQELLANSNYIIIKNKSRKVQNIYLSPSHLHVAL